MKKQNIIPIIALLALVSMMIVPVMAGGTYTGNFSIDFNTYSAYTYPDHHAIYKGEIYNNQTLIIGNASAYWNSINNGNPARTLNTPTRNWNLGPDEHWMYSSAYYTQEQDFVVNPTTMQGYGWLVFRPRIVDIDTFAAVWKYVNTEYIPPPPIANFQFGSYVAIAPGIFTAYSTSNNSPTSYSWGVIPSIGITLEGTTTANLTIRVQYTGNYSVTLTVNKAGYNASSITKYLVLGTSVNVTPGPTVNITPFPTITGISTIATLPTGLPGVINRTQYKNDIEADSLIGNLTAPFINMMDSMAYTVEQFAYTIIGYLTIPFTFITTNLMVAENLFTSITQPFINGAHWILYTIGMAINGLPPGGQELGTLCLLGSIFYTVMRGRMGNS